MTFPLYLYNREQAIADGILLDVTTDAQVVGIPFPTAISRGLWDHPEINRQENKLRVMLGMSRSNEWLKGDTFYDKRYGIAIPGCRHVLMLRTIVEPSRVLGTVVTTLCGDEQIDASVPWSANGPLYVM